MKGGVRSDTSVNQPFPGFSKGIQIRAKNPYTLTRMPPTQCVLSGEIRFATKLLRRPYVVSTRCRSLGPKGTPGTQGPGGRKGTQGDPRGPKGAFGALGGEWAHGALWGLFRSHFEWKVISNGRLGPSGSKGTQRGLKGRKGTPGESHSETKWELFAPTSFVHLLSKTKRHTQLHRPKDPRGGTYNNCPSTGNNCKRMDGISDHFGYRSELGSNLHF